MNYNVIVPCAGSGTRTNLPYNKVFYKDSHGKMMIERTLELFLQDERCTRIVLATSNEKEFESIKSNGKVFCVAGGSTREESVKNALVVLEDVEYVLVHDGDRPFVTKTLIDRVLDALDDKYLSVIPGLEIVDATIYKNEYTDSPVYKIQTPQGFNKTVLLKAFEGDVSNYRDEGSVVLKRCGIAPCIVKGEIENIKITYPEDLKLLDKE